MQHHKVLFKARFLPYLLIVPQLLVTLLFFIYPAIMALWQSFQAYSFWGLKHFFIGFDNYVQVLSSSEYYHSFAITLLMAGLVTVFSMALGLLLALCVNRVLKARAWYKTLILWPYAVAPAVAGVLWGFLFNPALGLLTHALHVLGIDWNYLAAPWEAFAVVVLAAVWQQASYNFIFYLAALQAVPTSIIESAALDGANAWQRFWHMVWPLLSPMSFFLLVMNLVYAFFDSFGIIATMTQGGPANGTNFLAFKVYLDGFVGGQVGHSAAQSVLLMVVVLVLVVFQFRFMEKKVHY